jgi:hypothetical protein
MMDYRKCWNAAFIALIVLAVAGLGTGIGLAEEQAESDQLIGDMKGAYVRLVYNTEGWVVLGYQVANDSLGEDWMLLEVGMTLIKGQKNQTCTRDKISVLTPEGESIALATQVEFTEAGRLRALNKRGDLMRDSINYFPTGTTLPCRIGFFADHTDSSLKPFDQFELAYGRGCLGRIFFKIPGGIKMGQYFLVVQFDNSTIKVPFKIMTKKEAKANYKAWRKQQKEEKKGK